MVKVLLFGINEVSEQEESNDVFHLIQDDYDPDLHVRKSIVLDHIEAVLISAGEPFRNKQGGRFGKDVTHYRQYKGDVDKSEKMEEDPEEA